MLGNQRGGWRLEVPQVGSSSLVLRDSQTKRWDHKERTGETWKPVTPRIDVKSILHLVVFHILLLPALGGRSCSSCSYRPVQHVCGPATA